MASTSSKQHSPKGPSLDGLKSSTGSGGHPLPSASGGRNLTRYQVEALSVKASKLPRKQFRELPSAVRSQYRASVRRTFHELLKSEPSWIYIITNPAWPDFCKIGVTLDIRSRLRTYRVSSPFGDFECVYAEYFHEHDQYINDMYLKFGESRGHGEWFKVSVADASAHLSYLKEKSDAV